MIRCVEILYNRNGERYNKEKRKAGLFMYDTNEKTGVAMVSRAMAILNYLSEKEKPVGISEIAKDMGLPKATVFRILNSLEEWDAVECKEGAGYHLGCFLIKLGRSAGQNASLIDVCAPHMERIAKEIGENLNLSIEYENAMLSIYSTNITSHVLSPKSIPISPLYCSSMGKAALAYLSKERFRAYFKRQDLRKRTPYTLTTQEELEKECEKIRREGVAFDNQEYEEGLYCISVPILNGEGGLVACLGTSGAYVRMTNKQEKIIKLLKDAKELIEVYTESMDGFVL